MKKAAHHYPLFYSSSRERPYHYNMNTGWHTANIFIA